MPVSASSCALRTRGLVRSYAGVRAVDGVDLSVAQGSVHGLLGPNGAGKTTLLRMVLGLVAPDAGTVELWGRPAGGPPGLAGVGGFVEAPQFYPYLSGRAMLALLARLDGGDAPDRVAGALDTVGLAERAGERVGGYSLGMRQRLGIAAALLRDPRLLVLDEPANGLDPAGQRDLRALLRGLAAQGCAVLLSSHDMTEVEHVCDTLTMVASGRVVWDGSMAQLRAAAPPAVHLLSTSDDTRAGAVRIPGVAVSADPLRVQGRQGDLDAYVLELGRHDIAVRRLEAQVPPLAALFFALTEGGGALGDPAPLPAPVDEVPA